MVPLYIYSLHIFPSNQMYNFGVASTARTAAYSVKKERKKFS